MAQRVDLVFSYWIFAWFLVYLAYPRIVSPFMALVVGSVDNLIMLLLMIVYRIPWLQIAVFVLVNLVIKVAPLWWLVYHDVSIDYVRQIVWFIGLFALYSVWLWMNRRSYWGSITNFFSGLSNGTAEDVFTPHVQRLLHLLEKL